MPSRRQSAASPAPNPCAVAGQSTESANDAGVHLGRAFHALADHSRSLALTSRYEARCIASNGPRRRNLAGLHQAAARVRKYEICKTNPGSC
jgi:hypothetical protein